MSYRLFVVRNVKADLIGHQGVLEAGVIRKVMDTAWGLYLPQFTSVTGPMIAETYLRAFQKAESGQLPAKLVYNLAEEHAARVGKYFHDTSTDAMIQGFNQYVNKRVPQRAAIERVVDAYGLTPRQVSGLVSAVNLDDKVNTVQPRALRARLVRYVAKSLKDRLKTFVEQEDHNLKQQANQVAWLWMKEHGHLPGTTQKMWITAKDEKVCAICGPMHRVKVDLDDQFIFDNGVKLYVPGAHVNCRCEVRLMVPVVEIGKAWDAEEHPRGGNPKNRGQFSRKPTVAEPMSRELQDLERQVLEDRQRQLEEQVEQARKISMKPAEKRIQMQRDSIIPMKRSIQMQRANEPIQMQRRQVEIKSTPAKLVTMSPETRRALNIQMMAAMDRVERKEPARPKIREVFKENTQFLDEQGRAIEGYAFQDDRGLQYSEATGLVKLTDEIRVTPMSREDRRIKLFNKAMDVYDEKIREVASDKVGNKGYAIITMKHPEYGVLSAEVAEYEVYAAADAVARPNDEASRDQLIPLEWKTSAGDIVFGAGWDTDEGYDMSPLELAEKLGITIDDIRVNIIKMDEGAPDAWQSQSGTKSGEEIWRAPGTYRVLGEPEETVLHWMDASDAVGHQIPVRIISVTPDTPEIFFAEREMTDKEMEEWGYPDDWNE